MGATSVQTVGRYQPEQLPNITGSTGHTLMRSTDNFISGAFSGNYASENLAGAQVSSLNDLSFNANNSNSVYTTNGQVRPLSLSLNYVIKC